MNRKERIAQLEKELARLREPWPWRATKMEGRYFFVKDNCTIGQDVDETSLDADRYNIGNYFAKATEAEDHAMRIKSMRPTCPIPEDGDTIYMPAVLNLKPRAIHVDIWRNSPWYISTYRRGLVHITRESAQEWFDTFSEIWAR